MNINLEFKPFKDFWINCMFNMRYSVLISIEPSFKYSAYLNNYTYEVLEIETPTTTKVNYLMLCPLYKFGTKSNIKSFFSFEPINFKFEDNYIDIIKKIVSEGNKVLVGVDLFYWIPNSICWNKNHWEHYSLINGFNDEKKVFYVLDENLSEYNEHEIPEEQFRLAIDNSPLDPHGLICKVADNVGHFKLSLEDVVSNARRLVDTLTKVENSSLFQLSDEDLKGGHMMDLFTSYLTQVQNRQNANRLLFNLMRDEKIITDNELIDALVKYAIELHDGWLLVKCNFMKAYASKYNQSTLMQVNKMCSSLFHKEIEMWNNLLSYTINK